MRNIPGSAVRVDPTMEKSTPDRLAWIHEHFECKPAGRNCRPIPVDPDHGRARPLSGSDDE